jgi:hypothetical protein
MRLLDQWLLCVAALALSATSVSAQTQTNESETLLGEAEASLLEIGRQINNPISPLWSVTFDNAIASLDGGGLDDDLAYTGTLQPFMPVDLSKLGFGKSAWAREFRIITRLSIPFFETTPLGPGPGDDRKSGFGDIQLGSVLAPSRTSGWLWGIGPSFIFLLRLERRTRPGQMASRASGCRGLPRERVDRIPGGPAVVVILRR